MFGEEFQFTDGMVLGMMNDEVEKVRAAVRDGTEVPSYIAAALTDDGEEYAYIMVVFEWDSPEQKSVSVRSSGYVVVKQMSKVPICIVLVSEAWVVTSSPDEVREDADWVAREGGLSQHPRRRECYFVQALTYDGRTSTAFLPFDRVDGRKVFVQDDLSVDDDVRQVQDEEEAGLAGMFFEGAVVAADEFVD